MAKSDARRDRTLGITERTSCVPLKLLTLSLFSSLLAELPFTTSVQAQVVQGLIVDSITSAPVAEAVVILVDSAGVETDRTQADHEGQFLLYASTVGEHRLRVESQGYQTSSFPAFTVMPDAELMFVLLLPSLSAPLDPAPLTLDELTKQVCLEGTDSSRPIMMGFVRYANTHEPVAEAGVSLAWPPPPTEHVLDRWVPLEEQTGIMLTDSTGFYALCGVPRDLAIRAWATTVDRVSDVTELRFTADGVLRDAGFVSMPYPVWRQDFELPPSQWRTAVVRGVVTDATSQAPVAGATVALAAMPSLQTSTSADGTFTLAGLPAGPSRLDVRHQGHQPGGAVTRLARGDTATLSAGMLALEPAAMELDPITVSTTRPSTRRPLEDFWERREHGFGSFITRAEFEDEGNPQQVTEVLQRLQGVYVIPNPRYLKGYNDGRAGPELFSIDTRRWIVTLRRGGPRTFGFAKGGWECPPLIFRDEIYLGNGQTVDIDTWVPLDEIEAIEAYGTVAGLPQKFNRPGSACGVIVFWTR